MIKILTGKKDNSNLFPEEIIRHDEVLVEAITQYCEENNLDPIYIDGNIAIFKDDFKMAIYEEEY